MTTALLDTIPIHQTPSNSSTSSSAPIPKTILARMFSMVAIGHLRFVIMDCPSDKTTADYLKELKIRGVTHIVRVCEDNYDKSIFVDNGISFHDWPYPDGGLPPPDVLSGFLNLCESQFGSLALSKDIIQDKLVTVVDRPPVIAVHCVAGLGRAPVMVAVCLIEAGLAPLDAIDFIRKCRRGAFNATQLKYLIDTYRKRTSKSSFGFLKRSVTPPKDSNEPSFLSKLFRFKKPSNADLQSTVNAQQAVV